MRNSEVHKDFSVVLYFPWKSLHVSEVADQNGGYVRFCSMQVGDWVFLLPLGWDASPSQGYP